MEHLAASIDGSVLAATRDAVEVGRWISAALTLILTLAIVLAARWVLRRRDPVRLATDPGIRTRVRLLQRMLLVAIVLVGLAATAAQLKFLDGIANTVLAGSAITAIVVGFAARATLANTLAGIVITITQPLRVGDHVTIGEHEGVVHDVTLSATALSTVHGSLIRIPNEVVAQSVIVNDTIEGNGVIPEATVLLRLGTDVRRAVDLALSLDGVQTARISAVEIDGWNRLLVRGERCAPGERLAAEARLRLALLDALRTADLLGA